MDKLSIDIWTLFLESKKRFPASAVFKIGFEVLNVLEYIHSKGYIHGDIKGANIMLGSTKPTENQVYLVDFKLCSQFDSTFKPDNNKAHFGTIEYLSRDAHLEVKSKRGDLETLAYNLVQWLGCVLPRENIKKPESVQQSKENSMSNIVFFLTQCFGKDKPPEPLVDYLNYVANLKFENNADYEILQNILISGVDTVEPLLHQLEGKSGKKKSGESTFPQKKVRFKEDEMKLPKANRQLRKIVGKENNKQEELLPLTKRPSRKCMKKEDNLQEAKRTLKNGIEKEKELEKSSEENGNYENEEMKRLRTLGQKKKTKAEKSPVSTAIKPDRVLRTVTNTPISPIANKNTEVEVTRPKYARNCKNNVNYCEMSLDNSTATHHSSDSVSLSGSENKFAFVTQRKKRPNL